MVYLDHAATTPLDPRVRAAMEPWLGDQFGNAASRDHRWGWDAAAAVDDARAAVAEATSVATRDVSFVSGATDALNAVVRGYVGFGDWHEKRIVTCATEHDAVLASARHLCRRTDVGLDVLCVDDVGAIDLDCLRTALEAHAGSLVALMAANNEIGSIHPVVEIAQIVDAAGSQLLCDTTQAIGKSVIDSRVLQTVFAPISAHKIHGPKGAGALLVPPRPRMDGVESIAVDVVHDIELHGGTVNVPGIVGLAAACRLTIESQADDVPRMRRLRDRLEDGILADVGRVWINGGRSNRLCNISNIGFKGIDARTLIRDMHDIAVSTRSACSSGNAGPSHVLKAIGLSDEDAYSCVRFSLGRFTTQDEIDYTIGKVVESVHKLRRAKSACR